MLGIGIGLPGAEGAPDGDRVAQAPAGWRTPGWTRSGWSEVLVGDGTPALEPVVLAATVAP